MESITMPKYYGKVCKDLPSEYSDYDNFTIAWGRQDYYAVIKKLGGGRYSDVYEGINIANNQCCVIKILKPIEKFRLKRELMILQILVDEPNIIKLYDVVKDPETKIASFVFESSDGVELYEKQLSLTNIEIPYYLYKVLKALDYCNSKGIMHRDIKSENIIINKEKKTLKLIDWGLAEFYHYGDEYNLSVSSLNYRAPEILAGDIHYDYSLDMWSLGCVFAEMIFKMETFFDGNNNPDQLKEIAQVLGTADLMNMINKYKLTLGSECKKVIKNFPKVDITKFIDKENESLINDDALDLLKKMLVYDKAERITAKDAMEHPYFAAVRQQFEVDIVE